MYNTPIILQISLGYNTMDLVNESCSMDFRKLFPCGFPCHMPCKQHLLCYSVFKNSSNLRPRPHFQKGKGLCNSHRILVQQFSPDSGENYYASYELCMAMVETNGSIWRWSCAIFKRTNLPPPPNQSFGALA